MPELYFRGDARDFPGIIPEISGLDARDSKTFRVKCPSFILLFILKICMYRQIFILWYCLLFNTFTLKQLLLFYLFFTHMLILHLGQPLQGNQACFLILT